MRKIWKKPHRASSHALALPSAGVKPALSGERIKAPGATLQRHLAARHYATEITSRNRGHSPTTKQRYCCLSWGTIPHPYIISGQPSETHRGEKHNQNSPQRRRCYVNKKSVKNQKAPVQSRLLTCRATQQINITAPVPSHPLSPPAQTHF